MNSETKKVKLFLNSKLLIWPNGKKHDSCFEIYVNHTVNSLRRLKDFIVMNLNNKYTSDKIKIYDYKEIELDDADINYLHDKQTLYVSFDGSSFSVMNYVNEHEFVHWIKSGGYGKVYMARNVITKEEVAVKKQDISCLSSEEIYNISREGLYLQSFKHKTIVKFINSYVYENHFYTVMDCAKGGELNAYLGPQNLLSEWESRRVFKQIHEAVRYIHSKNVVHRDLKPNNILFLDKNRENLVLIDFGISGVSHCNVKEAVKAGTTKFIPPEIASGLSYNSSTKIDIWALGVMLYMMLTGKFPFDGKSDSEIQNKIISEPFKFPANLIISKSGFRLMSALLEKNQHLRIEVTDALFDDWYNDENVSDKIIYKEDLKNSVVNNENKESVEEDLKIIEEELPNKLKITKNNFNGNNGKEIINIQNPKSSNVNKRSFTPQKKESKKSTGMNSSSSQGVFNLNGTPGNTNKNTNAKASVISPVKHRNSNGKKTEFSLSESSSSGNNFGNIFKKKK